MSTKLQLMSSKHSKALAVFGKIQKETDDSDSDSDPSSTDQNEVSEVEEEQSEEKRAEIKRKLQKTTEKVENRNESKLQITRYDPAADDQDQFLRKEPEPLDQNVNQKDAAETMTKKFEIKTDLKQAFNSENTSGGFSFGFLGEHDAENENEIKGQRCFKIKQDLLLYSRRSKVRGRCFLVL